MSTTLLILNAGPYGSEDTYNGLRLAGAIARRADETVRVFLMGDAAHDSARHSEHDAVSGVLAAMGIDAVRAAGDVRLSVGRTTRGEDVHCAADCLVAAWRRMVAA